MKPERAVEMTGAWKTRKTKPRFPFVFPSPWKSLRDSHIPTAPAMFVFPGKTNPKTQERNPAERASELHPFRLILGLENASSQLTFPRAAPLTPREAERRPRGGLFVRRVSPRLAQALCSSLSAY